MKSAELAETCDKCHFHIVSYGFVAADALSSHLFQAIADTVAII